MPALAIWALVKPFLTPRNIIIAVIVGVIAFLWLDVKRLEGQAARDRLKAVAAAQQATVSQGQAVAATSAAQIVAQGVERHDLTIHLQQENARAILSAPGAGQALDPGLNAVGRRGLCAHRAYADDPECVGLRSPDPAAGQGPRAGNAPAAR